MSGKTQAPDNELSSPSEQVVQDAPNAPGAAPSSQPAEPSYTHDSEFFTRKSPLDRGGRGYQRSNRDMKRLKKKLKYGRYLELPKGSRSLFASPEQKRQNRSLLITILFLLLVVIFILSVLIFNIL